MTFQYVAPTDRQKELMQEFRDKYQTLAEDIKYWVDKEPRRGFSLAITKLEESAMWLNKAITKND